MYGLAQYEPEVHNQEIQLIFQKSAKTSKPSINMEVEPDSTCVPESVTRQSSSSSVFEVPSTGSLGLYDQDEGATPVVKFDTVDTVTPGTEIYQMDMLEKALKEQKLQEKGIAPAKCDVTIPERQLYNRLIGNQERDNKMERDMQELREQLHRKEQKIEELTTLLLQEKEHENCHLKRKIVELEKEKKELQEKLLEKEYGKQDTF